MRQSRAASITGSFTICRRGRTPSAPVPSFPPTSWARRLPEMSDITARARLRDRRITTSSRCTRSTLRGSQAIRRRAVHNSSKKLAATSSRARLCWERPRGRDFLGARRPGVELADIHMNEVNIKVRESGPYLVRGNVTLTDADGNQYIIEGENVALCRCGGSHTKPFCDGSHRDNGFAATERAAIANEGV